MPTAALAAPALVVYDVARAPHGSVASPFLVNDVTLKSPKLLPARLAGYGGLGVITDTTLSLVENVRLRRRAVTMPRYLNTKNSSLAAFAIQAMPLFITPTSNPPNFDSCLSAACRATSLAANAYDLFPRMERWRKSRF